jgi:glycosyltransferase involved in cell wall biosynthesis
VSPATIYITRNGLLEPLGQSQVMAYLRGLAKGYRITLITYEKAADRADEARMARMRAECETLGIRWLPQRFRASPKVIAPALSMLRMVWLLLRETRGQKARLIHARSYIPAAVALIVSRVTGVPFLFDMRALWPEELITAGRLRRGSWLHRAIVAAERTCLARAGAVVSLTEAAVLHLRRIYPEALAGHRIAVIPTCADLARFAPAASPPTGRIIGCLGTVLSGWFRLDWLASFLAVAAARDPDARFELTTLDDPRAVRAALDPAGQLGARLTIAPSAPDKVQEVLQRQTASVMFFTDGLSKLGSSPTRMGEILGCGMPVLANDGVGDVAAIIRRHRVGVLAASAAPEAMAQAWDALMALLAEPDIAARCRAAAEEVFSLEAGTRAYAALYRELAGEAG